VEIVGNDAAWADDAPQGTFGTERLVATKLVWTRYDKVVEALGVCEHVVIPGKSDLPWNARFCQREPLVSMWSSAGSGVPRRGYI